MRLRKTFKCLQSKSKL